MSNAHYQKCVTAGACIKPSNDIWSKPENADYPVTDVNWQQASAYAKWAGGQLPSEAQWEKAARGPDGFIYPWGDTWNGSYLNFCDKNCTYDHKDASVDDGYGQTAPVGRYLKGASPYGAYDLAGNVSEWVADWYAADYYTNAPTQNPPGPETGKYRSMRGGSRNYRRDNARAADRVGNHPSIQPDYIGFRVVRLSSPGQ